ncbi:c-type heme family protein [Roseateles sp. GG27B]
MKLLLKFNLIFLLVFVLGLGAAGYIARELLQKGANEEVLGNARLLMESALAVSTYTAKQIKPLLENQMKYAFLPQSVPAYSSSEVVKALGVELSDYSYKPAMLNPTNPRDRAQDWEEDVIGQFAKRPELTEYIGQRSSASGMSLFIARPIRISDPACLQCHSTVDVAPTTMVDKYGAANGFGWKLNDTLGAQIVSVPMDVPLKRANAAFGVVMGSLTGVFILVGVALNLMLWKLVIQPVTRLSGLADQVSLGKMDAPEFASGARDEIGVLSESFARMRRSLVQAMKMLDE